VELYVKFIFSVVVLSAVGILNRSAYTLSSFGSIFANKGVSIPKKKNKNSIHAFNN